VYIFSFFGHKLFFMGVSHLLVLPSAIDDATWENYWVFMRDRYSIQGESYPRNNLATSK
jgi:hypothetical protein